MTYDTSLYQSFVTGSAISKNIRYSTSTVHNLHRQGLPTVKKTGQIPDFII